jgi:hypothetical protein
LLRPKAEAAVSFLVGDNEWLLSAAIWRELMLSTTRAVDQRLDFWQYARHDRLDAGRVWVLYPLRYGSATTFVANPQQPPRKSGIMAPPPTQLLSSPIKSPACEEFLNRDLLWAFVASS